MKKKIITNFAAYVIFWEFYCLRFYNKVFVVLLFLSHWVTSDCCGPMRCSLPGSSGYGISQARILQWVAIFFSKGSFQPRDRTRVSWIAGRFFTDWATREAQISPTQLCKTSIWGKEKVIEFWHCHLISYLIYWNSTDFLKAPLFSPPFPHTPCYSCLRFLFQT